MIRHANSDDTALLMALTRAAFAESAATPYPSSALNETWEDAAAAIESGVLLCMHSSRSVGACRYQVRGEALVFSRLCVLPGHQRRGHACRLLDALEEFAHDFACTRIECSARSAYPDNRAFYQRRGYELVGYEDVYGVKDLKTLLVLRLDNKG